MTFEEAESYVKAYAVVVQGYPDDVLSVTERAANPEAMYAMKVYVTMPGPKKQAAASFVVSPISRKEIPEAAIAELCRRGLKSLAMLIEKETAG